MMIIINFWCLGYSTGGEAAVSLTDCSFSWDGTRDSEKTTLQKLVPLFFFVPWMLHYYCGEAYKVVLCVLCLAVML